MFSIGLVAIATVTALPIGGGATTYISMNEQIAAYGMEPTMGMFDMCIARIPVFIIALVCAIWICPKLAPDRDVENDELKLRTIKETEPLSPFREFCGYGIYALCYLWMESCWPVSTDLGWMFYVLSLSAFNNINSIFDGCRWI